MSSRRGACEDTALRKVLNEPYLSAVMGGIMQQDVSGVTLFHGRSGIKMNRGPGAAQVHLKTDSIIFPFSCRGQHECYQMDAFRSCSHESSP